MPLQEWENSALAKVVERLREGEPAFVSWLETRELIENFLPRTPARTNGTFSRTSPVSGSSLSAPDNSAANAAASTPTRRINRAANTNKGVIHQIFNQDQFENECLKWVTDLNEQAQELFSSEDVLNLLGLTNSPILLKVKAYLRMVTEIRIACSIADTNLTEYLTREMRADFLLHWPLSKIFLQEEQSKKREFFKGVLNHFFSQAESSPSFEQWLLSPEISEWLASDEASLKAVLRHFLLKGSVRELFSQWLDNSQNLDLVRNIDIRTLVDINAKETQPNVSYFIETLVRPGLSGDAQSSKYLTVYSWISRFENRKFVDFVQEQTLKTKLQEICILIDWADSITKEFSEDVFCQSELLESLFRKLQSYSPLHLNLLIQRISEKKLGRYREVCDIIKDVIHFKSGEEQSDLLMDKLGTFVHLILLESKGGDVNARRTEVLTGLINFCEREIEVPEDEQLPLSVLSILTVLVSELAKKDGLQIKIGGKTKSLRTEFEKFLKKNPVISKLLIETPGFLSQLCVHASLGTLNQSASRAKRFGVALSQALTLFNVGSEVEPNQFFEQWVRELVYNLLVKESAENIFRVIDALKTECPNGVKEASFRRLFAKSMLEHLTSTHQNIATFWTQDLGGIGEEISKFKLMQQLNRANTVVEVLGVLDANSCLESFENLVAWLKSIHSNETNKIKSMLKGWMADLGYLEDGIDLDKMNDVDFILTVFSKMSFPNHDHDRVWLFVLEYGRRLLIEDEVLVLKNVAEKMVLDARDKKYSPEKIEKIKEFIRALKIVPSPERIIDLWNISDLRSSAEMYSSSSRESLYSLARISELYPRGMSAQSQKSPVQRESSILSSPGSGKSDRPQSREDLSKVAVTAPKVFTDDDELLIRVFKEGMPLDSKQPAWKICALFILSPEGFDNAIRVIRQKFNEFSRSLLLSEINRLKSDDQAFLHEFFKETGEAEEYKRADKEKRLFILSLVAKLDFAVQRKFITGLVNSLLNRKNAAEIIKEMFDVFEPTHEIWTPIETIDTDSSAAVDDVPRKIFIACRWYFEGSLAASFSMVMSAQSTEDKTILPLAQQVLGQKVFWGALQQSQQDAGTKRQFIKDAFKCEEVFEFIFSEESIQTPECFRYFSDSAIKLLITEYETYCGGLSAAVGNRKAPILKVFFVEWFKKRIEETDTSTVDLCGDITSVHFWTLLSDDFISNLLDWYTTIEEAEKASKKTMLSPFIQKWFEKKGVEWAHNYIDSDAQTFSALCDVLSVSTLWKLFKKEVAVVPAKKTALIEAIKIPGIMAKVFSDALNADISDCFEIFSLEDIKGLIKEYNAIKSIPDRAQDKLALQRFIRLWMKRHVDGYHYDAAAAFFSLISQDDAHNSKLFDFSREIAEANISEDDRLLEREVDGEQDDALLYSIRATVNNHELVNENSSLDKANKARIVGSEFIEREADTEQAGEHDVVRYKWLFVKAIDSDLWEQRDSQETFGKILKNYKNQFEQKNDLSFDDLKKMHDTLLLALNIGGDRATEAFNIFVHERGFIDALKRLHVQPNNKTLIQKMLLSLFMVNPAEFLKQLSALKQESGRQTSRIDQWCFVVNCIELSDWIKRETGPEKITREREKVRNGSSQVEIDRPTALSRGWVGRENAFDFEKVISPAQKKWIRNHYSDQLFEIKGPDYKSRAARYTSWTGFQWFWNTLKKISAGVSSCYSASAVVDASQRANLNNQGAQSIFQSSTQCGDDELVRRVINLQDDLGQLSFGDSVAVVGAKQRFDTALQALVPQGLFSIFYTSGLNELNKWLANPNGDVPAAYIDHIKDLVKAAIELRKAGQLTDSQIAKVNNILRAFNEKCVGCSQYENVKSCLNGDGAVGIRVVPSTGSINSSLSAESDTGRSVAGSVRLTTMQTASNDEQLPERSLSTSSRVPLGGSRLSIYNEGRVDLGGAYHVVPSQEFRGATLGRTSSSE